MEGILTEPQPLSCGVPQGSPVSPVLFMLYLERLLKLGDARTKFGYADDIAILRTGISENDIAAALAEDVENALRWGESNAVTFDPKKCELIHFSRKAKQKSSQFALARALR